MMKLILCLALTWLFFSTGESQLDCVYEQLNTISNVTCEYVDDLCATLSMTSGDMRGRAQQHIIRNCVQSTFCTEADQMFSISEGGNVMASSISCCNTDQCNNGTTPYMDIQTENGLTCASCASHQSPMCENIISIKCVGIQDRCIDGNVTDGDMDYQFLGCVSANLCDVLSEREIQTSFYNLHFTSVPKCCKTSRCNSAGTVKLSVAPLLLGLVVLVVC
ncbi:phospholipase A2 inhibitor and Ly6/PLAUR domain-containing protein [Larimichthys crocea]|uniref:Uncharacterized protein n=1 Tax=Larimichthys crocea TaxID=215358 RepID=A0ACD3RLA8_LARCR|nr:phospholipase A2 inhibitor and Ly6/PLAUR domain-containing protein [Larimichthys crocea]